MKKFKITKNEFLKNDMQAFYSVDYTGYGNMGNPNYLNILKNTFGAEEKTKLLKAINGLTGILSSDLPKILTELKLKQITICVIPRAKCFDYYSEDQLIFKSVVGSIVRSLVGFTDGTSFIVRHTDTKTTHLQKQIENFVNDGPLPYPGITKDTCTISDDVIGRDILLIDDIYTKTVNIDEDTIQALLDKGAKSVAFYAVSRTIDRRA